MTLKIYKIVQIILVTMVAIMLGACDGYNYENKVGVDHHGSESKHELEKGPHGGRLLKSGDFSLELSIFETGVPPEFRVWATNSGEPLKPENVDLNIKLTRLGNKIDDIDFKPYGDALRGNAVIYEPHSFTVTIRATYEGNIYDWEYDNFEGRTKINDPIANALDIETSIAEAAVIKENIRVYGKIVSNTEGVRNVNARFDGVIKSVKPSIGDTVKKGQVLALVESNESLKVYSIVAPITGVITHRTANTGEQTNGRNLFTIMDTSTVWVDLSLFPSERHRVKVGMPVIITTSIDKQSFASKIQRINVVAEANQSVLARVILDNSQGKLLPGTYVTADISIAIHPVSLAVKREGLQTFRDFTVVYAKINDEYEVRMLDIGRRDSQWVEVLGGLEPGTRYVSKNSYIIKADIEKSGASHDH